MIGRIMLSACAALLLSACVGGTEEEKGRDTQITPDLTVRYLDEGVWLHTSWREFRGQPFPSHGLLVRDGRRLILVDTAWGEAPTRALLEWADAHIGLPVSLLIATHTHSDRLGGAQAVLDAGGEVFLGALSMGGEATRWRASDPELLRKGLALASPGRAVAVAGVEVYYPGPAHTRDNLMVWLPRQRILFGGCAVRHLAADGLGNVRDADVGHWASAVEAAAARYPSARLVVPSHGDPGDLSLLGHTADLARAAAAGQARKP